MRNTIFRLALPLFDTEGGGAGAPAAGAGASSGGTGASAPGASATGNAAPAGTPAAGSPPATPAPQGFTYKEDRSNWVPSHVVRQRTEALQKLQRDYDLAQSRVAALSGVAAPKPAANPEFEAIRNQLLQVAPELKDVFDSVELLKELKGLNLKDTLSNLQGFATQSWQQRGSETLRTLSEKVKQAYGGADLSPKQVGRIGRAFIGELEDDPELRARYEAGDPSVVDEFVKDFTTGLLDPYRRSTAAAAATGNPNAQGARRLPRGGGGQPVAMPARTVKPADGDAFHKGAFDAFQRG